MNLTDNSTLQEVFDWLVNHGISRETAQVIKDNEVDGFSLLNIEDKDLHIMLPCKVGPVRKILTLVKNIREPQNTITTEKTLTGSVLTEQVIHINEEPQPCGTTDSDETVDTIIYIDQSPAELPSAQPSNITVLEKENQIPVQNVPIDQYVPSYSAAIKLLLENGEIYKEWDKFVKETAYHVLAVGAFGSRGLYQDFGRLMFSKYPCLSHSATKEPWGYFNQKLSQKVRRIRWKWNTRGKNVATGEPNPKKKKNYVNFVDLKDESTIMKPEHANKVLEEELQKATKEQDKPLLFKAQRCSFKERRTYISGLPNSNVKGICTKFPILSKCIFIEKEFYMILENVKKDQMMENFDKMPIKLNDIFDSSEKEKADWSDEEILACLDLLEEQIKYSAKAKSIQPLITCCKPTNLNLASKKSEAPRLLVILNEDGTTNNCFVLGEGMKVEVEKDLKTAILRLLFCYYVWDLSYPKQYQTLGFIQTYVLEDQANKFIQVQIT